MLNNRRDVCNHDFTLLNLDCAETALHGVKVGLIPHPSDGVEILSQDCLHE